VVVVGVVVVVVVVVVAGLAGETRGRVQRSWPACTAHPVAAGEVKLIRGGDSICPALLIYTVAAATRIRFI
jgi:hypothetical protein